MFYCIIIIIIIFSNFSTAVMFSFSASDTGKGAPF